MSHATLTSRFITLVQLFFSSENSLDLSTIINSGASESFRDWNPTSQLQLQLLTLKKLPRAYILETSAQVSDIFRVPALP